MTISNQSNVEEIPAALRVNKSKQSNTAMAANEPQRFYQRHMVKLWPRCFCRKGNSNGMKNLPGMFISYPREFEKSLVHSSSLLFFGCM